MGRWPSGKAPILKIGDVLIARRSSNLLRPARRKDN
jgi:hypothetical protein